MKKILLGVMTLLFFTACASKTITITGEIEGIDSGTSVILNTIATGKPTPVDTVTFTEGKFAMTIDTMQSQLLLIMFEGQRTPIYLFGGDEDISINGSINEIDDLAIVGGDVTNRFVTFNRNLPGTKRMGEMRNEASKAQMMGDTAKMNELQIEYRQLMDEQMAYVKNVFEENTSNIFGAWLCLSLKDRYSVGELQAYLEGFEEASLGNHMYVQMLKDAIEPMVKMAEAQKATEIGEVAPVFTLKTKAGDDVSLDSFKGKVVLVDFWASWCAPCRQENPNVVKAYKKYNSKGFDILSVSVDRDEAKWLEAIQQDQLTWTQVRDIDGAVAETYAIRSIPTTLLLDAEGKIIAKNLRGEELFNKLDEVLK